MADDPSSTSLGTGYNQSTAIPLNMLPEMMHNLNWEAILGSALSLWLLWQACVYLCCHLPACFFFGGFWKWQDTVQETWPYDKKYENSDSSYPMERECLTNSPTLGQWTTPSLLARATFVLHVAPTHRPCRTCPNRPVYLQQISEEAQAERPTQRYVIESIRHFMTIK